MNIAVLAAFASRSRLLLVEILGAAAVLRCGRMNVAAARLGCLFGGKRRSAALSTRSRRRVFRGGPGRGLDLLLRLLLASTRGLRGCGRLIRRGPRRLHITRDNVIVSAKKINRANKTHTHTHKQNNNEKRRETRWKRECDCVCGVRKEERGQTHRGCGRPTGSTATVSRRRR